MASGSHPTTVARHTKVVGQIESAGAVRVEGRVEGTLRAGGALEIASGAVAIAELHAPHITIAGVVIGNAFAAERIDVAAGARVVGDLRAPRVDLAAGATLEGRVHRELPAAADKPAAESTRATLKVRAGQADLRRPSRPRPNAAAAPADEGDDGPPLPALARRRSSATPMPPSDDDEQTDPGGRTKGPPRATPEAPRPASRARMVTKPK